MRPTHYHWHPIAIVLALSLPGFLAVAQSQNDKTTGLPPASGATDHGSTFAANQLVGEITKIDPATHLLTIKESGATRSLRLGDDTTVFVEGRLGTAQDLKEGQQVRAAFETRSGQLTLRWIEVAPAAVGAPAQGPSTPPASTKETKPGTPTQPPDTAY